MQNYLKRHIYIYHASSLGSFRIVAGIGEAQDQKK